MRTSNKGISLIKEFEGLKLKAYQDSVGIWTVGYGTTRMSGRKVLPTDVISQEQAEDLLRVDLIEFEKGIIPLISVAITQNMFDALISFCYNLGLGSFKKSTLRKKLNFMAFDEAANEFVKWNKAGGKVLEGLTRRRLAEKKLFLTKD